MQGNYNSRDTVPYSTLWQYITIHTVHIYEYTRYRCYTPFPSSHKCVFFLNRKVWMNQRFLPKERRIISGLIGILHEKEWLKFTSRIRITLPKWKDNTVKIQGIGFSIGSGRMKNIFAQNFTQLDLWPSAKCIFVKFCYQNGNKILAASPELGVWHFLYVSTRDNATMWLRTFVSI